MRAHERVAQPAVHEEQGRAGTSGSERHEQRWTSARIGGRDLTDPSDRVGYAADRGVLHEYLERNPNLQRVLELLMENRGLERVAAEQEEIRRPVHGPASEHTLKHAGDLSFNVVDRSVDLGCGRDDCRR